MITNKKKGTPNSHAIKYFIFSPYIFDKKSLSALTKWSIVKQILTFKETLENIINTKSYLT